MRIDMHRNARAGAHMCNNLDSASHLGIEGELEQGVCRGEDRGGGKGGCVWQLQAMMPT